MILGIKIEKHNTAVILIQSHYIDRMLQKLTNLTIMVSQLDYSQAIERLMNIINCIKPYVSYTVSKLSKYTSNPRDEQWMTVIRVVKYLNRTMGYGLHDDSYSDES